MGRTLLVVILAAVSSVQANALERVAVLEFTGDDGDMSHKVLETITDEARRAAVDVLPTTTYSVITRENQETVLREQGVDAAKMCDAACEVDLARTIGASLLVTGSVKQIGTSKILQIKLFHAERGQVLKIVKVTGKTEADVYEKSYDAAMRMFIDGLGISVRDDDTSAPTTITPPPSGVGSFSATTSLARVNFRSEPTGARVLVDGIKVCDATPCTADVPRRTIVVRMDAVDHLPAEDKVKGLDGLTVSLTMKPAFGLVRVTIEPAGLPLLVDGRPLEVPAGGLKLDNGTYTFSTGDACFDRASSRISVERGKAYEVSLRAIPTQATLRVDASIDGKTSLDLPVVVDGNEVGRTGRDLAVWACASQVQVTGPEDITQRFTLDLKPKAKSVVKAVFSQAELDEIEANRAANANRARLNELEREAEAERQAVVDRDARTAMAFRETTLFWWNLGFLSAMVVGGSLLATVALLPFLGPAILGFSPVPTPSSFVGDDSFGTALDISFATLGAILGLSVAVYGVTVFFSSDLSAAPIWPSDFCYDPCACAVQPLVPGACLGVE